MLHLMEEQGRKCYNSVHGIQEIDTRKLLPYFKSPLKGALFAQLRY